MNTVPDKSFSEILNEEFDSLFQFINARKVFIKHLKLVFPDTKMCFKRTKIKSMALASVYTQRSVKIIAGLETRHFI